MDLNFECVECGLCCHGLKLSLSIAEAKHWLSLGHDVEVLCEAIPWPTEPAADNLQAAHKRRQSFASLSGSMPIRVIVTLTASFANACPHLGADSKCAIYDDRPNVCRIYPAELNPFVVVRPEAKACPPEAWSSDRPPLIRGGMLIDDRTRALIQASRHASESESQVRAQLCRALGIRQASMSNEGFVVHAPAQEDLAQELARLIVDDTHDEVPQGDWVFVSSKGNTVEALEEIGATAMAWPSGANEDFAFLGFDRA